MTLEKDVLEEERMQTGYKKVEIHQNLENKELQYQYAESYLKTLLILVLYSNVKERAAITGKKSK